MTLQLQIRATVTAIGDCGSCCSARVNDAVRGCAAEIAPQARRIWFDTTVEARENNSAATVFAPARRS
ncbi:hypothetical protein [Mycobacterium haemophilum]|uniref:hypothetical protein n=1 Tax=Mycobacterium haemophilum TaxID=29311 RepID=UPI003F69FCA2